MNVIVKRKMGIGDRWETRSQMGVDCKTEAELETMVKTRCECECKETNWNWRQMGN